MTTPRDREQRARLTKFNGAPNAQSRLRVIDRCPKGKAKAQRCALWLFLKGAPMAQRRSGDSNPAGAGSGLMALSSSSNDSGSRRHQSGASSRGPQRPRLSVLTWPIVSHCWVVACRGHRDRAMHCGRPSLSNIGSGEGGQGSASAPRRNAMANLAEISPCAGSASASVTGVGC